MNLVMRALMAVAVALSPREFRETRREQWLADVRDAAGEGLQPSAVAAGALWATLATNGRRHAPSTGTNNEGQGKIMVLRAGGIGYAAKFVAATAGTALIAGLGTGGLAMWAVSKGEAVLGSSQRTSQGSTSDSAVYATLADDPVRSKVDLSTLKIVGMIDPATGEITDFATPRSVASLQANPPEK